jgi:hypothetical protein
MELTAWQNSLSSRCWRPVDKETGKAWRCGVYHAVSAIAVTSVKGCNCGGDRERRRSAASPTTRSDWSIFHMDRILYALDQTQDACLIVYTF